MTRAVNTLQRVAGLLRQPAFWLSLGLLLDLTFVQLDRLYLQGALGERFSFENENSYPEHYQHVKELAAAVLAAALFATRRDLLYACWIVIFSYMFLDDTFELHERLGATAGAALPSAAPFGLREDHAGELIVSAIVGLSFLVLLAFAWRRGTEAARKLSRLLVGMLLCLAAFGVGLDAFHGVLPDGAWRYRLGIIEDGGELVVLTLMIWLLTSATVADRRRARPMRVATPRSDGSRPTRYPVQHRHRDEVDRGEEEHRPKAG